eukprot:s1433_g11.t1
MKRPREREEQSLQCEADISSQSIAAPSQSTCAMSMKEEAADQDIESLGFHSPAADPTARVGRSSKKQTNAEMEDGLNKLAQRHAAQFQVKTETDKMEAMSHRKKLTGADIFALIKGGHLEALAKQMEHNKIGIPDDRWEQLEPRHS